jgi:hypothetical protein
MRSSKPLTLTCRTLSTYTASTAIDGKPHSRPVEGVSEGSTPSIAEGYWIFLKPLPVGEHVITFGSRSSITNRINQE